MAKAHKDQLTHCLMNAGFKVATFDLFGRFHCEQMSWVVEKILLLASADPGLRLVSSHALKPILASILTLPEKWSTDVKTLPNENWGNAPIVMFVGKNAPSNQLGSMGFQVLVAETMSKVSIHQGSPRDPSLQGSCSFPDDSRHVSDGAVAVTGMACNFSGASSLEEFWDILESGRIMCDDLPNDRFPDAVFEKRSFPKSFKANVLQDVDAFDHKFFNVSSREAAFMDPQQRLALQVTYQALESAGYFSSGTSRKNRDVGVYLGACTNEYYENICTHTPSAFSLTGSIRPFIAGKLSHYFGWTGPAIMYDTACAASGTAIHQACQAIATGEVSEAVAGGVNIFVSPETFQNLAAGHFISRTGSSKTFDNSADGYCRGEGVAMVTLKRLSAALRDGDRIRGVIAATAVGQNANETSITVPHGPSQMSLYRKALRAARLDPNEISYIEAHGTGTPVGDPIEVESIRGVFGSAHRDEHNRTYMGALKSNIGHTEATSGVSGLIKVLLMMEKKTIPRQAFFNELNPAIRPFGSDGVEIPLHNVPWKASYKAACVNNYGASGSNAVMIVTEPPNAGLVPRKVPTPDRAVRYPVFVAAFSASSLVAYLATLLRFIKFSKLTNSSIADIAYHLSRYRNPALPFSLCRTISSLDDLQGLYASAATLQVKRSTSKAPPVVLLFGGQTGKSAYALKPLYDSCVLFQKHLHACDNIIRSLGMTSIFPDIFDQGPHSDIVKLHINLFCAQYCSGMSWLECGLKPDRMIGHSFGQLTALCVAGVLSLHDGLRYVTTRARYIRDQWGKDPGSMIAIEANFSTVSYIISHHADLELEIACHNGPQSMVVAGPTTSVRILETSLNSTVYKHKRLEVTNAFHSVLCDPLLNPLRQLAEQLDFHDAQITLEFCSKEQSWTKITPELLVSHTREPVYFTQAVNRIDDQLGPCLWLEVGSEIALPILRRALGKRAYSHHLKSLSTGSKSPVTALGELTIDLWGLGIHAQYWPFHHNQQQQYAALNLPPYQFDKFRHWMNRIEPPTNTASGESDPAPAGPLKLIKKTENNVQFQINRECSQWQIACANYKIGGIPSCSLSLLLDIVINGIGIWKDESEAGSVGMAVSQFRAERSIPSNRDKPLLMTITPKDRHWSFTIANDSDDFTSTYVSGQISLPSNSKNDFGEKFRHFHALLDVSIIKCLFADSEADMVRGRGVYHALAPVVQVSQNRQTVKGVVHKGSEVAAYINQQSNDLSLMLEDLIHVPLICLNGLRHRQSDENYVNTAIGSAEFDYPFLQSRISRNPLVVFAKFFNMSNENEKCNIFMWDEDSGRICAVILDVDYTKVNIQSSNDIRIEPKTHSQSLDRYEELASNEPSLDVQEEVTQRPQLSIYPRKQPVSLVKTSFDKPEPAASHRPPAAAQSNITNVTTEILYNLLSRVADLDMKSIREDLPIVDLGIDSLMAIEVANEIQNAFAISISFQELTSLANVGSLCSVIENRVSDIQSIAGEIQNEPTAVIAGHATVTTESAISTPEDPRVTYINTPQESEAVFEPSIDVPMAVDVICKNLDTLAQETGCAGFWSDVYPAQTSLVIAYIIETFSRLHCGISTLHKGETVQVPSIQRKKLLDRFLCILRDEGLLKEVDHGWIRTGMPIANNLPSTIQFERIVADFPTFVVEHRLLHVVGSRLHQCLAGDLDPVSLLFGQDVNRKLMTDQYHMAPLQSFVSRQLVEFISAYFRPRYLHRTVRVLEVGGGTCGTTLYAVEAFSKLGIPVEYTFTDISQSFVSAAKAKLREYKFVVFRTLDISQLPPPNLDRQFDMIIATNVIHATPNIEQTVRNVRRMLRPTGVFAPVEYTRKLPILDVIFGQFDGWWAFNDGRDHAIMDARTWATTLQQAGFSNVEWPEDHSEESKVLTLILAY